MSLQFKILGGKGRLRRGVLSTAHGDIDTPCFMPVGTAATVKGLHPTEVAASGAQILLGNTYHLMLRPTAERIEKLGGLHKFMGWDKPILTDSGGFQVMSLKKLCKITEEGAKFKSPVDGGKEHMLTPERSIEIQRMLDSNIAMCLDECLSWPVEKPEAEKSMKMSMRWAKRSKDAFVDKPGYGIFGIVQGSMFKDLRLESIAELVKMSFDGYAVGGLAIGEPQETMFEVLDYTAPALPEDKPRYLMGVGKPADIVGAAMRGIDMFDCVMPTRSGRHGQAFVRRESEGLDTFLGEPLVVTNAALRDDPTPLDARCGCPLCRGYSRAYLHHLFAAGEMLGQMLLSQHNLWFYQDLMREIRKTAEA